MKRYDLLKVLGITFLIVVVLSWIIVPGTLSSGEYAAAETTAPIGIFDLFRLPALTIGTFFQIGIILLVIGGFYGVINKTGVYGKVVEGFSKKFKGKENVFLLITMIALIILTSLTGLWWVMFIAVPFLATVLLKLGFNKTTSLAATVGAILIGSMGCTYGFGINGYIINLFSLKVSYEIVTKTIFLVIISILYIIFVMKAAKGGNIIKISRKKAKKSSKKKVAKKENKKVETKAEANIPLYIETPAKKRSVWPLVIISCLAFILLVLGLYNFYYSFGIEAFQNFHTKVTEFTIGGYAIFAKILGTVSGIGYWTNYEVCTILILTSIVLGLIYRLKFREIVEGFVEGIKEMIIPATYAVLANVVFAFVATTGTGYTICDSLVNLVLSISKDFNVALSAFAAGIGSFFYNDFYYLMYSITGYYQASGIDADSLEVVGLIYQIVYGLLMLILPTSVLLIAGLSYFKVSYKEWFKYIWQFLVALLVIVIIVLIALALFL